jgi:hypothetical protein
MQLSRPLLALVIALGAAVLGRAQNIVYEENFSSFTAGIPAEEIADYYAWSDLPHPLNPSIVDSDGDLAIVLNSKLAYQSTAKTTVIGARKYHPVTDTIALYTNITFEKPYVNSGGLSLMLTENYSPVLRWNLVLGVDVTGQIGLRLEDVDDKNVAKVIYSKAVVKAKSASDLPIGLRLSRATSTLQIVIAKEGIATVKIPDRDLAALPDVYSFGFFAYNGQAIQFDDIAFTADEPLEPATP